MTDPIQVPPDWVDEQVGGFVESSSAVVDLGPPRANSDGPKATLFLSVEEEEGSVEFVWRFGVSEEEAGFGEAEIENGTSSDLEEAKEACWLKTIDWLRGERYTDEEIASSV